MIIKRDKYCFKKYKQTSVEVASYIYIYISGSVSLYIFDFLTCAKRLHFVLNKKKVVLLFLPTEIFIAQFIARTQKR